MTSFARYILAFVIARGLSNKAHFHPSLNKVIIIIIIIIIICMYMFC